MFVDQLDIVQGEGFIIFPATKGIKSQSWGCT